MHAVAYRRGRLPLVRLFRRLETARDFADRHPGATIKRIRTAPRYVVFFQADSGYRYADIVESRSDNPDALCRRSGNRRKNYVGHERQPDADRAAKIVTDWTGWPGEK